MHILISTDETVKNQTGEVLAVTYSSSFETGINFLTSG
jgi:hypothetical protein